MENIDIQKFYKFIRDTIVSEIQSSKIEKTAKKQPEVIGAEVVSVATTGAYGDSITITLAGADSNITIKNLTQHTLVAMDIVEVVIKNGNYGNAFIGWKRP